MYLLEIIARRQLADDHIARRMFPKLIPYNYTQLTITYASRLAEPLHEHLREIMQGWVEEGDILAFVCEEVKFVNQVEE